MWLVASPLCENPCVHWCCSCCRDWRPLLLLIKCQSFHVDLTVDVSPLEDGVVTAGDQYTIQCRTSRVATLDPSTPLDVMWLDPDDNVMTSGTNYTISGMSSTNATSLTSTLTFHQITTSQGGIYSCVVNISILDIDQFISQIPIRVTSK